MAHPSDEDERFVRATLRLARRHAGLTGTNPSVGTLVVREGRVVGRGITAAGGRPHAEPVALAEAGEAARGATAYVSLEPCAHHGVTPPCAEALIRAGVARVVTAYVDPDRRVDGRGHAMLRDAGIAVEAGVASQAAASDLAGYLSRQTRHRPHVMLKLAVSADGYLGRECEETPLTGVESRRQVHAMRARADAIMVGSGTAVVDDPALTCRLPGLGDRSPHRYVLSAGARLSPESLLATSAREVATTVVSVADLPPALARLGVRHLRAERHGDGLALPEVLDDLAARGTAVLMVEGGARVARAFLRDDLVDRLALFIAPVRLGGGIAAPLDARPEGFEQVDERRFGADGFELWERRRCSPEL